jgi:hypothetical protein
MTYQPTDSPIKFSSSPSSSEDDLPTHQSSDEDISSDDWRSSDYSPLWSSEKQESEEEDEDDADTEDDSDFASPPPK